MSLQLSNEEDWAVLDNRESLVLKVTGQADLLLDDCVVSEPYQYKELDPTQGNVLRFGTMFVWPKALSPRPPIGSIVLDEDGIYWTVWRLEKKQHIDCYEAFCLNLNIVTAAWNVATILKGSYGKGAANEAKATWYGLYSGLATPTAADTIKARFQPSDETAELEFGAEWSKETYRVYFENPLPVDLAGGEYRLVDYRGNRYRIMRYYCEERLDKLPIAIAVRITEGAEYSGLDS